MSLCLGNTSQNGQQIVLMSPIEYVGSWIDMQLRKRPRFSNVEESKALLIDIRKSIPQQIFVNHFKNMPKRMSDLIVCNGGYINK